MDTGVGTIVAAGISGACAIISAGITVWATRYRGNPGEGVVNSKPPTPTSTTFRLSRATVFALIIGAITGIVAESDHLIGLRGSSQILLHLVTYPIGGLLVGFLISRYASQIVPTFSNQSRDLLMWGWAAAWLVSSILEATVLSSASRNLSNIVGNGIEGIIVAWVTARALYSYMRGSTVPIFVAWIIAYVLVILFYNAFPARLDVFTGTAVDLVGNALSITFGCAVTWYILLSAQPQVS